MLPCARYGLVWVGKVIGIPPGETAWVGRSPRWKALHLLFCPLLGCKTKVLGQGRAVCGTGREPRAHVGVHMRVCVCVGRAESHGFFQFTFFE